MEYVTWDVDPVAFTVMSVQIRYYSLLLLVGIVLSVCVLKRIFEGNGMPWVHLQVLVILSMASLFIGARLGHCFLYQFDYYSTHPLEIFLPVGIQSDGRFVFRGYQGMSSHGGAIGWIVALFVYARLMGEKVMRTLDCIAIVLPLGACFIRLGNLMNSEIIGFPTNVPWAFVFERMDRVPRHPAQLYEALAYLIIFGLNLWLYRKIGLDRFQGLFWGMMLVLVFGVRFLVEFVKERQVAFEDQMSLDLGQVLSVPFILIGFCFVIFALWKKRGRMPA